MRKQSKTESNIPQASDSHGLDAVRTDVEGLRELHLAAERLANINGGTETDRYLGISSGQSQQPAAERQRTTILFEAAVNSGPAGARQFVRQIREHLGSSGHNLEVLRRLRKTA